MMQNNVFFVKCVICIILQALRISAGVSESYKLTPPKEDKQSKESGFVVPDLNKLPPEDHIRVEEGYTNQHFIADRTLQPSISHSASHQATRKRKRKKVEYSSLSPEEKAKRSKKNMERIRIRKQNMTKEERANWNAKNLIYLRKHRAKKSKNELQAQNRKYKEKFIAKQKSKLVNNTQSADPKPK